MKLSMEQINAFSNYLYQEEKSTATREKYLRDVRNFQNFASGREVAKELVVAWKRELIPCFPAGLNTFGHNIYALK